MPRRQNRAQQPEFDDSSFVLQTMSAINADPVRDHSFVAACHRDDEFIGFSLSIQRGLASWVAESFATSRFYVRQLAFNVTLWTKRK